MFIKENKNRILCFLGLCLIVPFTTLFFSFKKGQTKKQIDFLSVSKDDKSSEMVESAEIVIKDLILKEIERHKGLEVVINASEGKILHLTDKIECKNINCALSDNKNKVADLQADKAVIYKATKDVLLSGQMKGHLYEMIIEGQDINYNYSNQTLVTDKEMVFKHSVFYLIAQKSFLDLKSNKITMSGGIQSEILNFSAGNGSRD